MSRAAPRLKWHQLRRRRGDPAFLRGNLELALAAGAACEVDLVATADAHLVCLHDLTLDAETTGSGAVAAADRAAVERLRQRAPDGSPLPDPPLFLDEVVAAVRRHGGLPAGLVQLDLKVPNAQLAGPVLDRLGAVLGKTASAFTAGGCEWAAILRLADAAPGLRRGFDPLDFHEHAPPRDAAGYRALAERTRATAPGAAIYYLHADLVLAGLDQGVDMVDLVRTGGAEVDAWTIDADRGELRGTLRRLIAAGCSQITTNDPEALAPLVAELGACS
jgi:glycerophosphoryl diester phosphodiesterase